MWHASRDRPGDAGSPGDPVGRPRPALIALTRALGQLPVDPDARAPAERKALVRLAIDLHRVAPVLVRTPSDLSAETRETLTRAARRNAARALLHKAETLRLRDALHGAGCTPVVLKGWPLAERLTGTAGGRHAGDIDLLLAPSEIATAVDVLLELGYAPVAGQEMRTCLTRRRALIAECNDIELRHSGVGVTVELHWRTNRFRGWPDLAPELLAPGGNVAHPIDGTGRTVRVPEPGLDLIYLAMHGDFHVWLRLKWLVDIAMIFRSRGPNALMADLARARTLGADAPLRLAGHLANRLLSAPLPRGWPPAGPVEARAMRRVSLLLSREVAPDSMAARLECYRHGLRRARGTREAVGVLRYLLWRRVALGASSLGATGGT